MNPKKILVINPKGGCGKSILCYQVLAPFFFSRTKKIPLIYDLDIANSETETYSESKILKSEKKKLYDVQSDIIFNKETIIFDTGATTLAKKVFDDFDEKRILKYIDLFMIPLTKGEQSADSAIKMYETIKQTNKDAKICFVLSNVYDDDTPLEVQFISFLGDKYNYAYVKEEGADFDPEKGLIDEYPDASYITIPECSSFTWGQLFGKTVYELADKLEEFDRNANELAKSLADNPANQKKYKLANNKYRLAKRCSRYRTEVLEAKIFKELDNLLNK